MFHRLALPTALAALAALPACGDSSTPPATSEGPTYYGEVASILAEHCSSCHTAGGIAPFALTTHEEVVAVAPLVKFATQARTMPPWGVDNSGSCGSYVDARWLTDAQIDTLARWIDAGTPAGEPGAPLVRPEPEQLREITRTIAMATSYTPDATLDDDYRCFVVDPAVNEDAFLTAYAVRPGQPQLVHHVVLYGLANAEADAEAMALDDAEAGPGYTCFGGAGAGGSRFLAGWAPGTSVTTYPAGTGIRVLAGRKVVMQVHYNLAGGAVPDTTAVDLQLEPSVQREAEVLPLAALDLDLAPGQAEISASAEQSIDDDTTYHLLGVFPHMHLLGRSLRVEATHQGATRCVADVPRWDFHWQQFYFYEEPVTLVPGDSARLDCKFDTRGQTETVYWGEGTGDEMCVAAFYFTKDPR